MLTRNRVFLKDVFASINDLGILLTGSVENGSEGNGIITDLDFHLSEWEIAEVMALVPPAYLAGYGIVSASGVISSSGSSGALNDSPGRLQILTCSCKGSDLNMMVCLSG
jgi:hypothetical protein